MEPETLPEQNSKTEDYIKQIEEELLEAQSKITILTAEKANLRQCYNDVKNSAFQLESQVTQLEMDLAVSSKEICDLQRDLDVSERQNKAHHDDLHGRYPVCPWCGKQLTAIQKKAAGKKSKRKSLALEA